MSEFDYDLFVIGAGSGGVRAARMASGLGARVAIAESRYLGGTCVNVGCVPKKLFVYAAQYQDSFDHAGEFGWQVQQPAFDWQTLLTNKNTEIERLNGIYGGILERAGVSLFEGHATMDDPHTVRIGDQTFSTDKILIATGGWPYIPEIPGREHILSSNEIFFLEQLPKSIVIVGGGYIAVEFAGIFHGLGVDTTLIYRGDCFLRGFDDDVRQHLAVQMTQKGITVQFQQNITSIESHAQGFICQLEDGSSLETDCVMYATGRVPNTQGLDLPRLGIETNAEGAIIVNDHFQSSIENIYALGDVINRVQLTPVALAEGMYLAHHLYGSEPEPMNYTNIPTAVFSQPNIGTVGLTEAEARAQYSDVAIFKSVFKPMKYSFSSKAEKTLMKLIVDQVTDTVLGAHMIGPDAGEIIQGIGIAIKAGAKKHDFDKTIGIHPTTAEEFVTMREPVAD